MQIPDKHPPYSAKLEKARKAAAPKAAATKIIMSGPGGKVTGSRRQSESRRGSNYGDDSVRPEGVTESMFQIEKFAIESTREDSDLLPHEFLLRIAQGRPIPQVFTSVVTGEDGVQRIVHEEGIVYPDIDFRADAAKACAPYFAPRLSAVQVRSTTTDGELSSLPETQLEEMIQAVGEDIKFAEKKITTRGKKVFVKDGKVSYDNPRS